MRREVRVAVLVLILSGCSSSSEAPVQIEQTKGRCPASPRYLFGAKAAGAACVNLFECAPTCCSCPNGWRSFLSARCTDGRCADDAATCAVGQGQPFCSEAPEDDGGAEGGVTQVCAPGTAESCQGSALRWIAGHCCLAAPAVCTEGAAADCADAVELWTGARCCVRGASSCDDRPASACSGSGHWTGARCCTVP